MSSVNCDSSGGATTWTDPCIAPIFTIWITGTLGAVFPVLAYRSRVAHISHTIFESAKYFSSGIIIATAFIHLLVPAINRLTSPCLGTVWKSHPYPLMLAFLGCFIICTIGILAFHIGTAKLMRLDIHYDPHGYRVGAFVTCHPEAESAHAPTFDDGPKLEKTKMGNDFDFETGRTTSHIDDNKQAPLASDENAMDQLIGVAVLELGIALNSVLIGLTLPVGDRSKALFVAIILYQIFDGLAFGSRLAYLDLPHKYRRVPFLGAFFYGIMTPIGLLMGLGVRMTCDPGSVRAWLVSGVLDTLSASVLLYTGFVELLAYEFLFNPEIRKTSIWKGSHALTCMVLGYGAFAFLNRWA